MSTLLEQLRHWEKTHPLAEPSPRLPTQQKREIVVGGDVKWKPVDRQAAMLLRKANWLSQPPPPPKPDLINSTQKNRNHKTERPKMNQREAVIQKAMHSTEGTVLASDSCDPGHAQHGRVRTYTVAGETLFNLDDMNAVILDQIGKLPKETRPNVLAAQDARKIVAELTDGLGGDMERFKASTKLYLEDIRQTRFAMVSETAQMTGPLREVRQFFIGSDYKEQIERLREFVELCERLQKLKESGFLDSVADTMLRLAVEK